MTARKAPPKPSARKDAEPPYVPSVFDGKYRLLRLIGRGSAGSVHEGENLVVGKRVAIKILHADVARNETLRARFVAEARASAQISHPNVVDIYDFGIDQTGTPYIVMELLEGETLEELISRRGALPPALACEIMVQILAGLGAAHRFGIVHRDLKPANIVVTHPRPDAPLVKMLDFGIAKGVLELNGYEGIMGTPLYMAPEQARAAEVGPQADIYSAGVILYEMLAGEPPFSGDMGEVLKKVIAGHWKPLSAVNPAIPRLLALSVAAAMATDPARRMISARVFAKQLAPYVSQAPPHSVPHGPNSADAFLLRAASPMPEIKLMSTSDLPDPSRPPRDFPSLQLAKVAGKPKGEPLADSLLQSPIIPRAPTAPKIQLSLGIRDVEMWSTAPKAISNEPEHERETATPEPSHSAAPREAHDPIFDSLPSADDIAAANDEQEHQSWQRGMWAAAVGVGAGAVLAWLYRFG
jgi:serine/threonine protein kinase